MCTSVTCAQQVGCCGSVLINDAAMLCHARWVLASSGCGLWMRVRPSGEPCEELVKNVAACRDGLKRSPEDQLLNIVTIVAMSVRRVRLRNARKPPACSSYLTPTDT